MSIRKYIPKAMTAERERTRDNLQISNALERDASSEPDRRAQAELLECAAEYARKAAISPQHSNLRRSARESVARLYLNAAAAFVEVFDAYRVEYNINSAIDLAERRILKRRAAKDIEKVRGQWEDIKAEKTVPAIDLSKVRSARRR